MRHSQGLSRIPSSPRTPTPASIPLAQHTNLRRWNTHKTTRGTNERSTHKSERSTKRHEGRLTMGARVHAEGCQRSRAWITRCNASEQAAGCHAALICAAALSRAETEDRTARAGTERRSDARSERTRSARGSRRARRTCGSRRAKQSGTATHDTAGRAGQHGTEARPAWSSAARYADTRGGRARRPLPRHSSSDRRAPTGEVVDARGVGGVRNCNVECGCVSQVSSYLCVNVRYIVYPAWERSALPVGS